MILPAFAARVSRAGRAAATSLLLALPLAAQVARAADPPAEAPSAAAAPPQEATGRAASAPAAEPAAAPERFGLHYQATVATQGHLGFSAAYSGQNSTQTDAEAATSVVTDLFLGARLWPGAEVYLQPELSGGRGISSTLGVAAFPSGEVYRVGDFTPSIQVARAFLRQTFGLGGGTVALESGPNQLGGSRDRDALTVTVGKFAIPDFVDSNPVSNDPHTRFMSWGLFASGAYDYPADTRGYTWGVAAALDLDWWSVRAALVLEPQYANLLPMEWDVSKARGLVSEFEGRWQLRGKPGAGRVLVFLNDARMGSYQQALDESPAHPDVTATRAFGRTKAGFAASLNQELAGGRSIFARVSFNDGNNETWAFTEIDRSAAAGAIQGGAAWGREQDEVGAAVVASGISGPHRRYLAAGGYGFIIGDGALHFGPELLGELYYRAQLTREVQAGVNYEPIVNPAYNRDRGPIHVFTARVHVAF